MSKLFSFHGGTAVTEYKNTKNCLTERLPAPATVEIPLVQPDGTVCRPVVSAGDRVLKGQPVGLDAGDVSCPVYASVSGTVSEIKSGTDSYGRAADSIVIENDGSEELSPDIKPFDKRLSEASPEEIAETVRRAGIYETGGAALPVYARIKSAVGHADRLLIDCTECDQFVTVTYRLMLERPAEIINGAKILLRALGLTLAELCVEDSKPDAVNKLLEKIGDSRFVTVRVMKSKYPQGAASTLVYAVTGRELPCGKQPEAVGCAVFSAETCAAVFRTFATGMPIVERCVTVDGDCIENPKNLIVPFGTGFGYLTDYCGGLIREPYRIVNGGTLTGKAEDDLNAAVTAKTSAVLVFSKKFAGIRGNSACIRCGRCVKCCPMHLMPLYFVKYATEKRYDRAEKLGVMNCIGCGTCAYVCPGNLPIVMYIREAREAVSENLQNKSSEKPTEKAPEKPEDLPRKVFGRDKASSVVKNGKKEVSPEKKAEKNEASPAAVPVKAEEACEKAAGEPEESREKALGKAEESCEKAAGKPDESREKAPGKSGKQPEKSNEGSRSEN